VFLSETVALANGKVLPQLQRLMLKQEIVTHEDLLCIIEDAVQRLTEMALNSPASPAGSAARYLAGLAPQQDVSFGGFDGAIFSREWKEAL
jgi:hypothetical protein